MRTFRTALQSSFLLSAVAINLFSPADVSGQEQVSSWRLFDSTTRELVESIEKSKVALDQLIETRQMPVVETVRGFQTRPSSSANPKRPFRIQFDFPEMVKIDAIALYPVVRPSSAGPRSLGMPKQIRISFNRQAGQVRINLAPTIPTGTRAYVIHDNVAPSSPLPVWIKFESRTVSSLTLGIPELALISNNLHGDESQYGCMFAEIEIYAGEINVARTAKLSATNSLEREAWGLQFLCDDRTPLGQPEINQSPPDFRGYHSLMLDQPDAAITVDFVWQKGQRADAVRLHPAKPDHWNDVGGYGFPRKFDIRVLSKAIESDASPQWVTVIDQQDGEYANPGNNDITFPVPLSDSITRLQLNTSLLAPELADLQQNPENPKYLLALAEMSALHQGRLLPKPDSISVSTKPLDSRWATKGLVDGYTSTGKIITGRRWASDLSQRRLLSASISQQEKTLSERIRQQNFKISIAAVVLITLLSLTMMVNWTLARRKRIRAVMIDRERIANDLHDEVGGALGSISLLSQKLLSMSDDSDQKNLLGKIHDAASEARAGVREAVWATGASSVDNKTFESHLRTITDRMLPDCAIEWQSNGNAITPTFAPRKQHHFGMFFREAIHNIQKHAKASTVTLRFQWNPRNMTFTLTDNGEGLQNLPASSESFRTLRYRADQLPAKLEIDPNPDGGTCFTLTTPLT